MALTAWGFAAVGLFYTAFAMWLLKMGDVGRAGESARSALLMAVVASALWGWSCLLLALWEGGGWTGLGVAADLLRYACWYLFMLVLLRPNQVSKAPSSLGWLVPVAVAVLLFGVLALASSYPQDTSKWMLLSSMALPVFAMVLLEQVFRNASADFLWNIKPLCLGLAGMFLFDLYVYSQAVLFNQLDAVAVSMRGIVHALIVPLLLLSTTRRGQWLSRMHISPKAAFHSASLLIAGLYLVFMSGVGYYVRYFGGEWGRALQMGVVFLSLLVLVVLLLSATLRARLRVFLGKHFFRYRFDYRDEWLKFTRTLAAQNSPQKMGEQVIQGLAEMLESPGGGLWLKRRDASAFTQVALWNMAPTAESEKTDSPFCQFLASSGWVVNLEEYRSYARRYGTLELPQWLQDLPKAWLVVPLLVGQEMIGFCVVASARTRVDVNWEVNDLLKTAGQQAASFLSLMQATEALMEVRKFDAFNRMSAFVVHDLKNVVAQLSLMMKNAKRLGANPEFQQDMLMTVENALERMRQLMLQLREGATPPGTPFGVNLDKVIQRIEAVSAGRGRTLEVQMTPSVVARGHEERLERIIGHVVQNAFDATDPSGRVWLSLDRASGQARIVVGDTGQGMSPDFVRERLFKPFQTTKQAGMGIGAFESYQYVQELGGRIEVDSVPGRGTLIKLLLPLFESQKDTDLTLLEAT
jgi:putative PEP-CTERM system histidine kinase